MLLLIQTNIQTHNQNILFALADFLPSGWTFFSNKKTHKQFKWTSQLRQKWQQNTITENEHKTTRQKNWIIKQNKINDSDSPFYHSAFLNSTTTVHVRQIYAFLWLARLPQTSQKYNTLYWDSKRKSQQVAGSIKTITLFDTMEIFYSRNWRQKRLTPVLEKTRWSDQVKGINKRDTPLEARWSDQFHCTNKRDTPLKHADQISSTVLIKGAQTLKIS